MHRHLMDMNIWTADVNWVSEAAAVGVPDTTSFGECLEADETVAALQGNRDIAAKIGVHGTPNILTLRGGLSRGLVSPEKMLRLVRP